jgi:hypothetical protein
MLDSVMNDFTEKWTAAARQIGKLFEEAVRAEREACARIAEENIRKDAGEYGSGHDAACEAIAAKFAPAKALRVRSDFGPTFDGDYVLVKQSEVPESKSTQRVPCGRWERRAIA